MLLRNLKLIWQKSKFKINTYKKYSLTSHQWFHEGLDKGLPLEHAHFASYVKVHVTGSEPVAINRAQTQKNILSKVIA